MDAVRKRAVGDGHQSPGDLRPVNPLPEDGDGRKFQDESGVTILIYGSYAADALMISFEAYKQGLAEDAARNGPDVLYRKAGKGWIVISGQRNGRLVYTEGDRRLRGRPGVHNRILG